VPGYESVAWYGLFGPARLPAGMVSLLYREVAAISKSDEVRTRMLADGLEPLATTPQALGEFLAREIDKWIRVAKSAGISAN
jgi:tripartite-type tricarboxylate transporter receptor subunit TctC